MWLRAECCLRAAGGKPVVYSKYGKYCILVPPRSRIKAFPGSQQYFNGTSTHAQECFFYVAIRPDSVSWPPLMGLHHHTNGTHHTR